MMKNSSLMHYEIFNFNEIHSKYKKINMLKAALGFNEDKEVNEAIMFNLISEHNYDEFYLLEYIINKTMYAPAEIQIQNAILISLYNKPEKYKQQYKLIKNLYENNYIFKKFANSIRKNLGLEDKNDYNFFNYQIYEICSKYITNDIILEPTDVHLNLHFIQKWICEQNRLSLESFTDVEKEIIHHLANGYCAHELVEEDLIQGEKDKIFLNAIIHEILPAKCHVETINQVMAIYCCRYPNPEKTEPLPPKKFQELKEILRLWRPNDFL